MKNIRILQNQDRFTTKEYGQYVTPLIEVLNKKGFPDTIKKLPRNGFMAGLLMYYFANNYNAIVTVGYRASMAYGFLNRIFRKKEQIQVAKEFYFEENINFSLKKRLLSHLYRYAYKNLTAIIVNSKGEIGPYAQDLRLPESRFHFIPWPSSIDNPELITDHDNYILAVGRSLRDWETFFAAIQGLDQKFVVIASENDMRHLTIPDNTELHTEIPYDRYLELLKKTTFLVLPLFDTQRSTGQATFLEAMAYGKPVVAARVLGTFDYIEDGINGLLYTPGDEKDLSKKITHLWNDTTLQNKLAKNGAKTITMKFNKKNYAREMADFIEKCLMNKRGQV